MCILPFILPAPISVEMRQLYSTSLTGVASTVNQDGPTPLKSVGHVGDFSPASALQDADHVEPDLIVTGGRLRQVLLCQRADARLLAGCNGLQGTPESGATTQLDLHEDDGLAVPQNEVYLSVAGPVVSVEQLVPLICQVAECYRFSAISGALGAQLPTPA